ncbi:MAG TPA: response regulator [Caulobacteraceae bacterium]|nr:response regulator [Caulobacteraceae bacterium]
MPKPPAPAPPEVVIVEDDDDLRRALTFAFELEGFRVSSFPSAEALLGQASILGRPCLVIDYWLPMMTGLALLNRLREQGHDLPAVLITTPTREIERRAALAGIPIVDKPLLNNALVAKVRDLLNA